MSEKYIFERGLVFMCHVMIRFQRLLSVSTCGGTAWASHEASTRRRAVVGRCRLTVSKPELKAPCFSA
jgi:hypothetical protein